jgi:hypothetical protein
VAAQFKGDAVGAPAPGALTFGKFFGKGGIVDKIVFAAFGDDIFDFSEGVMQFIEFFAQFIFAVPAGIQPAQSLFPGGNIFPGSGWSWFV